MEAEAGKPDDKQEDRKTFIEKLIGQGIFQKVDVPGTLPKVWVTPAFYALDFEMKQKFISVVYVYYMKQDSRYHIVILRDSRTGKDVGTYSAHNPGLKMK